MLTEMLKPNLMIIFVIIYISCDWTDACATNFYKSAKIMPVDNASLRSAYPDEPLFLSPYLRRGDITEARQLAKVPFTSSLFQKPSFAGFFTVNEMYNSNHYFWYFPPTNADSAAPLIVWLAGGPGASSIYGIFAENGPFRVVRGSLVEMSHTLIRDHHVVFIDSPVGAGFSFTEKIEGYCKDEAEIGEQLYSSVIQFLTLFPELYGCPMYIAGVSYGGKYAPALAYTIHQKNLHTNHRVHLKGIIIGNGFTDPVNQIQYGDYFYQLGLIDGQQKKVFDKFEDKITTLIHKERWNDALDLLDILLLKFMIKVPTIFQNITGIESRDNYLSINNEPEAEDFVPLLPKMRPYLHVGNLPFGTRIDLVKEMMRSDMMKSVAPWLAELLNYYKVLIYNGQLDILVPYPLTVNYLRKLKFNGAQEYQIAQREIWRVNGEVAGYKKKAGNLVEALVRDAGHMAGTEKPEWTLDLISDFIRDEL